MCTQKSSFRSFKMSLSKKCMSSGSKFPPFPAGVHLSEATPGAGAFPGLHLHLSRCAYHAAPASVHRTPQLLQAAVQSEDSAFIRCVPAHRSGYHWLLRTGLVLGAEHCHHLVSVIPLRPSMCS